MRVGPLVDAVFAEPRLAQIYDASDPDRGDLDAYRAMAVEFGAGSVLDIGCGTGSLACRLALLGKNVTGLDPAAASLDVARRKPGADRVRWIEGDATGLPPMQVDLVTMTGNVAQVFLTDEGWTATLRAARSALRPGGILAFEVRDPAREAWREWNREQSHRRVELPGGGAVETWVDLTDVGSSLVSFRQTFVFVDRGAVLISDSTLRFRERNEITDSLRAAGLTLEEIRDAPDRPGLELVFIARRLDQNPAPNPPIVEAEKFTSRLRSAEKSTTFTAPLLALMR